MAFSVQGVSSTASNIRLNLWLLMFLEYKKLSSYKQTTLLCNCLFYKNTRNMAGGICNLSVVPLRASASHRSEIVSQVLFGESFEIVQHEKDWHLIRLMDGPYEGWIQHGQFIEITDGNCLPTKEESLIVDIAGGQALCGQDAVDLLPGVKIAKWMIAGNQTEFPYTIQADLRRPTLADFDTEFPKLVDYYKNGP